MSTNEENIDKQIQTQETDIEEKPTSNDTQRSDNTNNINNGISSSVDTINIQAKHITVDTMKLISDILLSPYLLLVSSAMIVYLYIRENNSASLFGVFSDFVIWTLFIVVITAHLLFQIYGVKLHNILFNILNSGTDLAKTVFKIEQEQPDMNIIQDDESELNEDETDNNVDENDENDDNVDETDDDKDGNDDNEVFHIPGNYYDFNQAKDLCNAYNARLAKYDEVETAYEDGAEWCSYGWSEGQMAFFPTQKETYNKLQNTENQKNNCGRPGVNGGYMANPKLRFGVNCYGVKPKQSKRDELYMKAAQVPTHSRGNTNSNNSFSSMLDKIIVSGFNYDKWNQVEKI